MRFPKGLLLGLGVCIAASTSIHADDFNTDRPDGEPEQRDPDFRPRDFDERAMMERRGQEKLEMRAREEHERDMRAREEQKREMIERRELEMRHREPQFDEMREREMHEREMHEREMREREMRERDQPRRDPHLRDHEHKTRELGLQRARLELQMAQLEFDKRVLGTKSAGDDAAFEAIKLVVSVRDPADAADFLLSVIPDVRSPIVRNQLRLQIAQLLLKTDRQDQANEQLRILITGNH